MAKDTSPFQMEPSSMDELLRKAETRIPMVFHLKPVSYS